MPARETPAERRVRTRSRTARSAESSTRRPASRRKPRGAHRLKRSPRARLTRSARAALNRYLADLHAGGGWSRLIAKYYGEHARLFLGLDAAAK